MPETDQADAAGSSLRFSVLQCTGEDPEHPVRELQLGLSRNGTGSGWHSPKYCDYPQSIVLRLERASQLKRIQILAHEFMIASRVEIFVKLSAESAGFMRLGYLSFDSNERSQHQARELKSVHIDATADTIKLVVHQCHANKLNMYSQVGIIALNFVGFPLENPAFEHGSRFRPTKVPPFQSDLLREGAVDSVTAARIEECLRRKAQAVEVEDYDEAKRLKGEIERLKALGARIAKLEASKQQAVAEEDYDAAKSLKLEMEKLRESFSIELATPQSITNSVQQVTISNPSAAPDQDAATNGYESAADIRTVLRPKKKELRPMQAIADPIPPSIPSDSELQAQQERSRPPLDSPPFHQPQDVHVNHDSPYFAYDERPAVAARGSTGGTGGDQPDMIEIPEGADEGEDMGNVGNTGELPQPEPLTSAVAKQAEIIVEVFGEYVARCVYSRHWTLREHAVKAVMDNLRATFEKEASPFFARGMNAFLRRILKDKVAQVFQVATELLDEMLVLANDPQSQVGSINECVQSIAPIFVERIGESNARIKSLSSDMLVKLSGHKAVGFGPVCSALFKPIKSQTQWRPMLARLQVLMSLINTGKRLEGPMAVGNIMPFVVSAFSSPNGDVRSLAINITARICFTIGPSVEKYLAKVKPQIRSLVHQRIEEYSKNPEPIGHSPGPDRSYAKKQEDRRLPPLAAADRYPADDSSYSPDVESKTKGEISDEMSFDDNGDEGDEYEDLPADVCQFCQLQDPRLAEGENMDLHFYHDCAMLVACHECTQIIEIASITEHMLTECDSMQNYQECPRCAEAVHTNEFKAHVKEKMCNPAKPASRANRCALCHNDIPPGEVCIED